MKKKLIGLAIIAPLFLSACSFQEVWGNIKDKTLSLFGQKAKEEKESGTTPGGTTPSDGSTTPSGGGDEEVLETASFDFSVLSATNGSSNGFSFTTAKGSGASDPAHNATSSELRLYISNTITFTSSNKIKSISFSANTCDHEKADGSFTVSNGTVSKVSGGFSWVGDTTSVTFTVSSGKQVHINSIAINDGGSSGGGGGGGSTEAEFPEAEVNAYTESLGVTDKLPAFSGTALSYTLHDDYGILDVEVGEGNVDAAISTYASDLLNAKFTEGEVDDYGDMHYISEHEELDVCAWDGQYSSTPAAGHMYIEIALVPTVEEFDSFPLEKVNTFLSENDFNLQFTQEIGTAISGYASKFETLEGVGDYGNYMLISFEGDYVDSLSALLDEHLTSSGYSIDTSDEVDYPYYSNDDYMSVSFWAEDGVTTIQLY